MKSRWTALDRLRALAVLLMVQGHTFNVVLVEAERGETWYRFHKLLHGLTAPMFLFGAGLAFGLTTYARWERHLEPGAALNKRLRRYGLLILLGYGLQLPGFSLGGLMSADSDSLRMFLRVGPLQLIAVSLLLCQLLIPRLKTPGRLAAASAALGLCTMIAAPLVWNSGVAQDMGLFFGTWVDRSYTSIFPWFPWASFVFMGVSIAYVVAPLGEAPGHHWRYRWLGIGGLMLASTYTLYRLKINPYPAHDFWNNDPFYVVFRLGAVLVFLGLLSFAARAELPGRVDRAAGTLAKASLMAYVVHLLILYGSPLNPSIYRTVGKSMDITQSILLFLLVLGVTCGLIVATEHLQKERKSWYRHVQTALTLGCLYFFVRY